MHQNLILIFFHETFKILCNLNPITFENKLLSVLKGQRDRKYLFLITRFYFIDI